MKLIQKDSQAKIRFLDFKLPFTTEFDYSKKQLKIILDLNLTGNQNLASVCNDILFQMTFYRPKVAM